MKSILAAVDFSDVTEAVVQASASLAKSNGAVLHLVHTEAPDPDFVGYDVGPKYIRDARAEEIKEDRHKLEDIEARLRKYDINVEMHLVTGMTHEKIAELVARFDVEMVFIGAHKHSALYYLINGDLAHDLVDQVGVPVVLVPPAADLKEMDSS